MLLISTKTQSGQCIHGRLKQKHLFAQERTRVVTKILANVELATNNAVTV